MVIMLAIVLTWLSGIIAVNNTTDKIYHYSFIVFYTFQVWKSYFFSSLVPRRPFLLCCPREKGKGKGGSFVDVTAQGRVQDWPSRDLTASFLQIQNISCFSRKRFAL